MGRPLRLLCVCTHNRTRSVLMGAFVRLHADTLGVGVLVRTAGFEEEGLPATSDTVRRLQPFGIDASSHRSARVDVAAVRRADLVVTAEQRHVVQISGQIDDAFIKTFSLPEFLRLAMTTPPDGATTFERWLTDIDDRRPRPSEYLRTTIGEIEDPTGGRRSDWKRAVVSIEAQTRDLCRLLQLAPSPDPSVS